MINMTTKILNWWPWKGHFIRDLVKNRRVRPFFQSFWAKEQLGCLVIHRSLGDGNTGQQFVQFLIVPDGQLQMSNVTYTNSRSRSNR